MVKHRVLIYNIQVAVMLDTTMIGPSLGGLRS
jgi:hypothetical protein